VSSTTKVARYRTPTTPLRQCVVCGAPGVLWSAVLRASACGRCSNAAQASADALRAQLHAEVEVRMARWLSVVPDEDIALLLAALLDNGTQEVFGITDHIVNLDEAAAIVHAADNIRRREWLTAMLCHRLADSLWTWNVLAPLTGLKAIAAPDLDFSALAVAGRDRALGRGNV
jgi:hypothetical protein